MGQILIEEGFAVLRRWACRHGLVYRHQLRPMIQTGATVMDELLGPTSGP